MGGRRRWAHKGVAAPETKPCSRGTPGQCQEWLGAQRRASTTGHSGWDTRCQAGVSVQPEKNDLQSGLSKPPSLEGARPRPPLRRDAPSVSFSYAMQRPSPRTPHLHIKEVM